MSGRGVVGQLLPRPAAAAGDHSPREPGSLPPCSAPRGPLSARGRLFDLSEKGIWRSKKMKEREASVPPDPGSKAL